MHYKLVITSTFILSLILVKVAASSLDSILILKDEIGLYEKFEAIVELDKTYVNPYDYDEVNVRGIISTPDGSTDTIDGFYMQNFQLNESNGLLIIEGDGEYRVRYAPRELGPHSIIFTLRDSSEYLESKSFSFSCVDSAEAHNHGFVRTVPGNLHLRFDDETPYIPIGENMAWQDNNPYLDYSSWLTALADKGGNFIRFWHVPWGLGLEWYGWGGYEGLRKYKQTSAFYQDWLVEFCSDRGIYLMLALHFHGSVSTQVNPNWSGSPYNAENGGPCLNTNDFFTDAEAIAHTRNRLRYIVARWGYTKSIMSWELFNEVWWTDNYQAHKSDVAEWHLAMADYIDGLDPNNHLISTSYGDDAAEDAQVWSSAQMDFTQSHIYNNVAHIERPLASTNRQFLSSYNKPTLNGEFGLGINGDMTNRDVEGIHLHNAIWGSIMSGGLGTAMTWWWEDYIHPQNLYYHFLGISEYVQQLNLKEHNMKNAIAYVPEPASDLALNTLLNWGGIGTDSIYLTPGNIRPDNAQLGQFLYGSLWNTQFRSPPVFTVDYTTDGVFSVTTGDDAGFDPTIEIWLDDILVLQDSAIVQTTYEIEIPAGNHIIKVDNGGTDWIKVADYFFEGMSSTVDAYVLSSEEKNYAMGWARNKNYNHQYLEQNGLPETIEDTYIVIEDFEDGSYTVDYYDPLTGDMLHTADQALAQNGRLEIPLTDLLWDVGFIVHSGQPLSATKDQTEKLSIIAYPNPIIAGQILHLSLSDSTPADVMLIDMSGRVILEKRIHQSQIQLPATLPSGHYWIRVNQNGRSDVASVVING